MNKDNITLVFNKSEIGAGTRGSSLGIDALITSAINKECDFFHTTPSITLENKNHVLVDHIEHPNAKHIEYIIPVYKNISKKISEILENKRFPLVISGDHASSGGTIAGIKEVYKDKTIGIVWIDAHADLHSPYTTPSGNVHGMPLATVIDEDNLSCAINDLDVNTKILWEELKSVGSTRPKVKADNIVFISVRDTEQPEEHLIDHYNIRNYTTAEVRKNGVRKILSEIKNEQLADCDYIYVTFDVDSLDCDLVSHGTGTPVKNGLNIQEGKDLMKGLVNWDKVVCLEVTEINPLLDEKRNKMADTTFEILSHALDLDSINNHSTSKDIDPVLA